MKTYSFIVFLTVFIVFVLGCYPNNQQKAEGLVKKYLDTTLNDPESYQGLAFTKLKKWGDGAFFEFQHIYRAKNNFGAVIKTSDWFVIDTSFKYCYINKFHINDADTARADTLK